MDIDSRKQARHPVLGSKYSNHLIYYEEQLLIYNEEQNPFDRGGLRVILESTPFHKERLTYCGFSRPNGKERKASGVGGSRRVNGHTSVAHEYHVVSGSASIMYHSPLSTIINKYRWLRRYTNTHFFLRVKPKIFGKGSRGKGSFQKLAPGKQKQKQHVTNPFELLCCC